MTQVRRQLLALRLRHPWPRYDDHRRPRSRLHRGRKDVCASVDWNRWRFNGLHGMLGLRGLHYGCRVQRDAGR